MGQINYPVDPISIHSQGGEREGQPGRGACLGVGAPAIVSSDGGALLPAVGHGIGEGRSLVESCTQHSAAPPKK